MKVSLRTKIIVAVVFLVTVAGSLTAYFVYKNSSGALENSIGVNSADNTKQVVDKIDRFLYERKVDVQQVAGREQIQRFLASPSARNTVSAAQLSKQLSDFKVLVGVWGDMSLIDPQGNIVLSTDQPDLISSLSKQPEFASLLKTATGGQGGYSDLITEATSNTPIMLFMFPVRDANVQGQPIVGVLVGELEWTSALEFLNGFKDVTATLLNSKGTFLGDNQLNTSSGILTKDLSSSAAFKYSQGATSSARVLAGINKPKEQFLTTYAKESGYLDYRGNGWTVVFQTPKQIAFVPARVLAKNLIITFILVMIVSVIALVAIISKQVLKPIARLKEASRRLATGDFSESVKISSHDEIGELARSFNDMAAGLQSSTRNLYEEHARLQASIDSLDVGLLMTFNDQHTFSYNPALLQIFGLHDVMPSADADTQAPKISLRLLQEKLHNFNLVDAIRQCQQTAKPFNVNGITYGSRILSIFGAPITLHQNQTIGTVVLIEDITEAKVLERSKDEFFSIASHELRTPLTSIKGNASMIMSYYSEALKDKDLKEMISDIHASSVRLIEIVNDFLDLSRLEQGKVTFAYEEFSLEEIVESVVYEMKAVMAEKQLHLTFDKMTLDSLPKVWADRNRTKQIIYNLVGNAAKFTKEGGVKIEATVEGQMVKVLVIDSGSGIPIEAQKLLFHKFQQAGSSLLTRDTSRGTGLGLYISKMMVQNMGGQIALEHSEEGTGTTFSFTLPIANAHSKETRPAVTTQITDTQTGLSTNQ